MPSEALEKATTFDLRTMEVANRYQHRRQTMEPGKTPSTTPKLSQKQMRAMIDRVRKDPRFNGQGAKK